MADPLQSLKRDFVSAIQPLSKAPVRRGMAAALTVAAVGQPLTPSGYTPVDTSGLGDFPWAWDSYGTFSGQTWNFLNNLFSAGSHGFLTSTAGLITAYYNVISKIAYVWSNSERTTINQQLAKINVCEGRVISGYTSKFNAIGPAEKAEAAQALRQVAVSALSYVINYKIGYLWSGRQAAGQPPLTPQALRETHDLGTLFTLAPDGAKAALLGPFQDLVAAQSSWLASLDALWRKSNAIYQASMSTLNPEVGKSGIYVVEPSGENVVRQSFSIVPSVTEIREQLSSAQTLVVRISAGRRQPERSGEHVRSGSGGAGSAQFFSYGVGPAPGRFILVERHRRYG